MKPDDSTVQIVDITDKDSTNVKSEIQYGTNVTSRSALAAQDCNSSVLLATAWIYIQTQRTNDMLVRALIDQGAQSSFITEELCQSLRLKRHPVKVLISGVGGNKSFLCKGVVYFVIKPHFSSTFTYNVTAYVIPRITSYNPRDQTVKEWKHLKGITIADPHCGQQDSIDVLLGAHVHALIIQEGLRKSDPYSSLIATKTSLGWIVSGSLVSKSVRNSRLYANTQTLDVKLNTLLRKFWEIEELPVFERALSEEELQCEQHYLNTVTRKADGRFVVRLPLKVEFLTATSLGDSYTGASAMLRNIEIRFERSPQLKQTYVEAMRDLLATGHMRRRKEGDPQVDECFFVPHHGVLKENSTTTKPRPVFNASHKSKNGSSINDFLHVGSNLLPELTDLVTKWRSYQFAFAADIEKMFRQIVLHELDHHLQAIV